MIFFDVSYQTGASALYDGPLRHGQTEYVDFGWRPGAVYRFHFCTVSCGGSGADCSFLCIDDLGDFSYLFPEHLQAVSGKSAVLMLLDRIKDREHRYFDCPKCRQPVRVPRGKGKIMITCPKCKERFQRKT